MKWKKDFKENGEGMVLRFSLLISNMNIPSGDRVKGHETLGDELNNNSFDLFVKPFTRFLFRLP